MADQVGPLTFSKKWEDVQGPDKSLVSWWGNRPFPFGCFRFWVWSIPNANEDQTLKFQVIYYKSSGMNGGSTCRAWTCVLVSLCIEIFVYF